MLYYIILYYRSDGGMMDAFVAVEAPAGELAGLDIIVIIVIIIISIIIIMCYVCMFLFMFNDDHIIMFIIISTMSVLFLVLLVL